MQLELKRALRVVLGLVALATAPALAQALPPEPPADSPVEGTEADTQTVVEVRVEGNRRVEAEAVRRALKTKKGKPFDPLLSGEDLRALWALNYFSDLQLLVQRLSGGVAYVVRVTEKPSIREVKLQGNDELSKDDFKETIDLKGYSILDVQAVRRNAKKIQEKYVEKGFQLAEVNYELKPVPNSPEVDVVFVIREFAKVQVKEVNFLGVEKVPVDELKAVMLTKESGLLSFFTSEGNYREEYFQRDLALIQAAYYDRGYVNVKIEKPSVSLSPDKRYIFIAIKVTEGEQYNVGAVDFSGDLLGTKEELFSQLTSKQGDVFNRSLLARDIQGLTDVYYDQGYAYANITPVTRVDPEKRTIDLTFDVQKGNLVTIERIEIVGNTKTRDKVIRRQLRVYEGELYNGTMMRRSKEKVTALGFFETVEVSNKPGSDNSHAVIQVEVKEKSTGTFQVGLGFSNVENFIFTAQVQQNNFLGWGQSVSASAQLSGLRSFLSVSFFDPYFLDTNYIFSIDAYRTQADYFGFFREATGGSIGLGYYILDDLSVNLGYLLERVNVEAGSNFNQEIPLANQFRPGLTSALRLTATFDKRNNRLFPTKGGMLFGSIEFAPKQLGGSFNFTRYTAYGRFYVPLPFGAVFKTNAQVGYIQQLDPANPLPISELYFLGGINTVRGYFLRSLTPTVVVGASGLPDATVRTFGVGGDKQFYINVELEIPILEKVGIRGVIFYDAGNAWGVGRPMFQDDRYNLPLGLYSSIGFGFRWFSPIGPLRFEWGIPLNRRGPEDQPVLFEFTIGNFF